MLVWSSCLGEMCLLYCLQFGKSLCYAVLPWAFDKFLKNERGHSIVIVVTPLLAIIEDQVS